MKTFLRKLSLVPRGLRYKLVTAFCLTSIIPLLVAAYLAINYIFPTLEDLGNVSIVILLTIAIAFLGMILIRRLVEPVVNMAIEARIISGGNLDKEIRIEQQDEIGELGNAINDMTRKIKKNLEELSAYGERTKQINFEIHKKVIALSNLLQVGDAITASTLPLDNVLALIAEKVSQTCDTGYTVLLCWEDKTETRMEVRSHYNVPSDSLAAIKINKDDYLFDKIITGPKILYADSSSAKAAKDLRVFMDTHGLKNIVIMPVLSREKVIGVFFTGNQLNNFTFKEDDIALYKIFARQIAIAIENDSLTKKTEELAITDDLTGLYNKRYIITRLDEEIKRAILFQRPCSFIIADVDDFNRLRNSYDGILIERALKKIAGILKENVTEIGKVARFGPNQFAMLFPEVNKKRAADISEDIRRKIEETFARRITPEDIERLTLSMGISENPIDGATADDLIAKAEKAVNVAKSLGKNRVIAHIVGG